ncbi:MAG: SPFH/Band 7/PHB domain protein [Lachnospiraceae bacterium]|nr:SPFH/Band 7/PHB domain protein [Lachnospiraceae bacterium]
MPFLIFLFVVAVIFLIVVVAMALKVVPQEHAYVIERFGKYSSTKKAGINIIFPFADKVARKVSLKEQLADFPPQPVITKDNVTMQIDTVVFYKVFDPRLYTYGVEDPRLALESLTATTLRNIIGELELDETLTSREVINTKMQAVLDEATDPWGIKVRRVEVKNIMPPTAIREAMEKQMKAERERREQILIAEGSKKAAILEAEGEKESRVLRAEALKKELVLEAEGHAENIRLHKQAEADGVKVLLEAGLSPEQFVQLKALDSFEKAADGKAEKIVIPSEIASLAGLAAGIKGSVKDI